LSRAAVPMPLAKPATPVALPARVRTSPTAGPLATTLRTLEPEVSLTYSVRVLPEASRERPQGPAKPAPPPLPSSPPNPPPARALTTGGRAGAMWRTRLADHSDVHRPPPQLLPLRATAASPARLLKVAFMPGPLREEAAPVPARVPTLYWHCSGAGVPGRGQRRGLGQGTGGLAPPGQ
jgi:hypothetical protein